MGQAQVDRSQLIRYAEIPAQHKQKLTSRDDMSLWVRGSIIVSV